MLKLPALCTVATWAQLIFDTVRPDTGRTWSGEGREIHTAAGGHFVGENGSRWKSFHQRSSYVLQFSGKPWEYEAGRCS